MGALGSRRVLWSLEGDGCFPTELWEVGESGIQGWGPAPVSWCTEGLDRPGAGAQGRGFGEQLQMWPAE